MLFPITLPHEWVSVDQRAASVLPNEYFDWLSSQSSLTTRIKELGIAFSVEVLSQTEINLSDEHKSVLQVNDSIALSREVLLKQGDAALVYAQTIMPQSTITGTESMLAELGNQSLGQVLFQSRQATRGPIEYSEVDVNSPLGQFIEDALHQTIVKPCYIRRSTFHLNNKPLLVSECFLPELFV